MIVEDSKKEQHVVQDDNSHESSNSATSIDDLSFRNLSKLILPPLGSNGSNTNQTHEKGFIITPMDSRYRFVGLIKSLINFYILTVTTDEVDKNNF